MEFHLQICFNSVVSFLCAQSLSAAVVQVYGAERNSSWVKKCCGVACLVKDNPQRSYFIRVFDMRVSRQMLYVGQMLFLITLCAFH